MMPFSKHFLFVLSGIILIILGSFVFSFNFEFEDFITDQSIDTNEWGELKTLAGHSEGVNLISWSPDGSKLVSGSLDSTIKIWDTSDWSELQILTGHSDGINLISFSADGSKLATGDNNFTVKIWDTSDWSEMQTSIGYSRLAAWSPDGSKLASNGGCVGVEIWDTNDWASLIRPSEEFGECFTSDILWSADGSKLAWIYRLPGNCASFGIWDTNEGVSLYPGRWADSCIYSVSWSPIGSTLASAATDNTIKIWDTSRNSKLQTLAGHSDGVDSVSWSPDGSKLVSVSFNSSIKIWNASDWSELKTLTGTWHSSNPLAWSPDGSKFTSLTGEYDEDTKKFLNRDATIKMWNTSDWGELKNLTGHTDSVEFVSWSPDGSKLASASLDATIKIWEFLFKPSGKTGLNYLRNHINNPVTQIGIAMIIIGLISSSKAILAKRSFDRENELVNELYPMDLH